MAVTINSGDLKHKVVFKQPVSSLNDEGGEEKTFSSQITTWAKVEAFKQNRLVDADVTVLAGALDFYIRSSIAARAVNKDWLIEYKAEDYTIHQVEDIEQKENFIRFTAKVRTNG